jgi:hypothetical protein
LIIPFFLTPVGLLMYHYPLNLNTNSQVWMWGAASDIVGRSFHWTRFSEFRPGLDSYYYHDLW